MDDRAASSTDRTMSSADRASSPSSRSNVWLAAPGEGVVTTYPWGTYAAGWGTSFSTPFVAGTAAVMLGANGSCSSSQVPTALANADFIGDPDLGFGRLNSYRAVLTCHLLP